MGAYTRRKEWCSREAAFGILALLVLVGLALRLDFLIASNFVIDADEAIVGLMALHMSEGSAWPVFYYGQHYMGSLEPLLVAILFRLFGPSSAALVTVPLLFGVALIPLTYLLARSVSGRLGALIAALLMAIPPTGLVVWSAKARGGFVEVLFLGGLALLLTVRWLRHENPSLAQTLVIGLILGLGWWTNNQIIYFMLPIGFFMLASLLWSTSRFDQGFLFHRLRAIGAHSAVGLLGFIFGGLPFWWYNVSNDFVSFAMFSRTSSSGVLDHISGLFSAALPMVFGAKRFWQNQDVFPYATAIVYVVMALLVLGYLVLRGRAVASLAVFKVDREQPVELFSLFVLSSLAVFVLSSFGWLYEAPRYLLPIYLGLFVLFGFILEHWYRYARWFAVLVLLVIVSTHLASSYWGGRAIPGEPHVFDGERVSKDHAELLQWLDENKVQWIRTNYWIGYRIAFETSESVRFLTYHDPQNERIADYRTLAHAIDEQAMPLVLVPAQGERVARALRAMGYSFQQRVLSGYHVIWGMAPTHGSLEEVPREAFTVLSSHSKIDPVLAVDSDATTRWGTGEPQQPGQHFELRFSEPQRLRGLSMDLVTWKHDFPRGLRVEFENSDGEVHPLFDLDDWEAIRYYVERESEFRFFFEQQDVAVLRLVQLGSDPIFDWSIAEILVLR